MGDPPLKSLEVLLTPWAPTPSMDKWLTNSDRSLEPSTMVFKTPTSKTLLPNLVCRTSTSGTTSRRDSAWSCNLLLKSPEVLLTPWAVTLSMVRWLTNSVKLQMESTVLFKTPTSKTLPLNIPRTCKTLISGTTSRRDSAWSCNPLLKSPEVLLTLWAVTPSMDKWPINSDKLQMVLTTVFRVFTSKTLIKKCSTDTP